MRLGMVLQQRGVLRGEMESRIRVPSERTLVSDAVCTNLTRKAAVSRGAHRGLQFRI